MLAHKHCSGCRSTPTTPASAMRASFLTGTPSCAWVGVCLCVRMHIRRIGRHVYGRGEHGRKAPRVIEADEKASKARTFARMTVEKPQTPENANEGLVCGRNTRRNLSRNGQPFSRMNICHGSCFTVRVPQTVEWRERNRTCISCTEIQRNQNTSVAAATTMWNPGAQKL